MYDMLLFLFRGLLPSTDVPTNQSDVPKKRNQSAHVEWRKILLTKDQAATGSTARGDETALPLVGGALLQGDQWQPPAVQSVSHWPPSDPAPPSGGSPRRGPVHGVDIRLLAVSTRQILNGVGRSRPG